MQALTRVFARTFLAVSMFVTAAVGSALVPTPVLAAPGITALSCTPPAADPEIRDLARALNYNLDLIYEYVYYNIDYSPTFGLKKGPLGTYLDKRGNNMDQNMLFVGLLRQSCISASYRYGVVGLPAAAAASLVGVDNDATLLSSTFAAGGIPACVKLTSAGACVSSGGAATQVNVQMVWTEVMLGDKTYELDPSFKSHQEFVPIGMASAMGFDAATFLNSATSGSSAVAGAPSGVSSIQGLNRANIVAKLNAYSQALANYIRTNASDKSMMELFGGRTITSGNYGAQLGSNGTLCAEIANCTSTANALRTAFTVKVSDTATGTPTVNLTYFADDIASKRLTLNYTASKQPVLTLDGTVVATGTATAAASQIITMVMSTPYQPTYNSYTITSDAKVGGTFAIMLAAGETGRDTLSRHQNGVALAVAAGADPNSEAVLGGGLAGVGAAYISQTSGVDLLSANLVGYVGVRHGVMGVAGYNGSTYVDFKAQLYSDSRKHVNTADGDVIGAFFSRQMRAGALESSTVKSLQTVEAVSTPRLFDYDNTAGVGFLQATPANWTSVKPLLTNWGSAALADMQAFITASGTIGRQVIVPKDGAYTVNSWKGNGYYLQQTDLTSGSLKLAYMISGGLKGGYGTKPLGFFAKASSMIVATAQAAYGAVSSLDPIDLRNGHFFYDHEDLKTGSAEFPFSLALSRNYESGRNANSTALGYGWRHNFMMSAFRDSDPYEAFGKHNPAAAVTTLVATQVIKDLNAGTTNPPLTNMVTSSIVASWLMDQLVDDAVTVETNEGTKKFVRIPTASGAAAYVPPPGDASALTIGSANDAVITSASGTVTSFDTDGKIASWKDKNGNTVSFVYSGTGTAKQLATVANGMGRTLTFGYNAGGQLATVSDGTRSVSYAYDSAGNLTSYKNTLGQAYTYGYSGRGLVTTMTNPAFPSINTVTNVYDGAGRIKTQADPFGNVWYYLFANERRSQEVDPLGNSHVFYYDDNGSTLKDIDQTGNATVSVYDGIGRRSKVTTPLGKATAYTYDARSNILTQTTSPKPNSPDLLTGNAPAPIVESWTYSALSKPLTHTDPLGKVTTNTYDANGNLLTVAQPAVTKPGSTGSQSPLTTITYNARGLPITVTDPEGRISVNAYDATTFDLLSTTIDAGSGRLNLLTAYTYDKAGNPLTVKDPNGNTTGYIYDSERRQTRITPPTPFAASMTQFTYDANGNRTEVLRGTGNAAWLTTRTIYNAANKPIRVIEPDGRQTTTAYDILNRVSTVTSSSGRRVRTLYNAASLPIQTTDEVSGTLDASITRNLGSVIREKRAYYPGGLLATLTDGKNNVLTYKYDGFERQAQIVYPDSTSELHAFDAASNELVFQRRDTSQIVYKYDDLNRLVSKTPTGQSTISRAYDYSGRLLSATSSTSSQTGISFAYDTAGRAISETSGLFGTMQFALDASGNRTKLTFPSAVGGLVVTDTYDSLNRLTEMYQGTANRIVGYGYDILGRRSTASYAAAAAPVASTTIGYTNADLESSITHSWNGASIGFGYAYNADRQKTSVSATDSQFLPSGLAALAATYSANNLNQYTAISGTALTYDQRGNLLTDGTWTYGYDTENRLVSASKSGLSVAYGYDALGRRLSRRVTNGTVATTYAWLSVGDQEWAEFSGTPSLSFAGATIYGDRLDEPVVGISRTNARSYYFQDALGSVIALTNASGQLTEKHAYTAFGLETTVGANAAAYRFAGRRVDPETGLSYNRARTYSPALGRFLQADPAGTEGGLNLYAYASNDPADITDPTGKWGEFKAQNRMLAHDLYNHPFDTLTGMAEASIGMFGASGEGFAAGIEGIGYGAAKIGGWFGRGEAAAGTLKIGPAESWGNPRTLTDHFSRHGADFGATSEADYANRASQFLQRSQAEGLPTKIDSGGTIRAYEPSTNTFGSYNSSGTTKTFFKPSSPTYWERQ